MYLAPKGIFRKTVLFRIAPKEPGRFRRVIGNSGTKIRNPADILTFPDELPHLVPFSEVDL